jgi:hypothetical protein
MSETQYLCWNCGLMQGAEDTPMEPSQLCAGCRKALRGTPGEPMR